MNEFFKLISKAFNFLIDLILKIIDQIFRLFNVSSDSVNNHQSTQSAEVIGDLEVTHLSRKPFEQEHYLLALEGEFEKQKLIINQEVQMYYALINPENNINTKRYAICPQASLGELFNVTGYQKDKEKNDKYRKIFNSKRADIAIVDKDNDFTPISLIEIIGENHYLRGKQESHHRDETVKIICQKCDVHYHEFFEKDHISFSSWIDSELAHLKLTNSVSKT